MDTSKNYIITSGKGSDRFELVSFDKALYDSKLANYNLVRVSSILPPNCLEQHGVTAKPGSVLFTAYASISDNKEGIISAAVGVGIPENPTEVGVIMEYSCCNTKEVSIDIVSQMVQSAMRLRGSKIKDIKIASAEVSVSEGIYSTAYGGHQRQLVRWSTAAVR